MTCVNKELVNKAGNEVTGTGRECEQVFIALYSVPGGLLSDQ